MDPLPVAITFDFLDRISSGPASACSPATYALVALGLQLNVGLHRGRQLRRGRVHGGRRLHDGDPDDRHGHLVLALPPDLDPGDDGVRPDRRTPLPAPAHRLPGDRDDRLCRDHPPDRPERPRADGRKPGAVLQRRPVDLLRRHLARRLRQDRGLAGGPRLERSGDPLPAPARRVGPRARRHPGAAVRAAQPVGAGAARGARGRGRRQGPGEERRSPTSSSRWRSRRRSRRSPGGSWRSTWPPSTRSTSSPWSPSSPTGCSCWAGSRATGGCWSAR